jgi:hypothetical protein
MSSEHATRLPRTEMVCMNLAWGVGIEYFSCDVFAQLNGGIHGTTRPPKRHGDN